MSKPVSFLIDDLLNKIQNSGEYISAIKAIELIATYQKRTIQEAATYLYHHNFDEHSPMYIQRLIKRNEFESEIHYAIADSKHNQEKWHQTSTFLHTVKWGQDDIFAKTEMEEVIHGFGEQIFVKSRENFLARWKDYCWLTNDLINFEPIKKLNNRELRGIKPDWNYWLNLYELDVLCLINLSMGLNPFGNNNHYSSLLDEVVIPEGSKEFELRKNILLSYIGNDGHPFLFKDEDKFSKIHAKIKIQEFVVWAKSLCWELPEELYNKVESDLNNNMGNPTIGHAPPEHYQQQREQLLKENEQLKARIAELETKEMQFSNNQNAIIDAEIDLINNDLLFVAALVKMLSSEKRAYTQSKILEMIEDNHEGIKGLSKSRTEKVLATANKIYKPLIRNKIK